MKYKKLDRTKVAKYQLPRLDPNNIKSEYYFTPELEKKFRKLYPITSNIMLMSHFIKVINYRNNFKVLQTQ